MASIDRADWHYGNDFPEELPEENGATHIGMYLNWIIDTDLISEEHQTGSTEGIQQVKQRQITGRDFLMDYCDEKLINEDLSETGLQFTEAYYATDKYINDYCAVLAANMDSPYFVENNWANYELIKKTLDKRYQKWLRKQNKKFWEFWK